MKEEWKFPIARQELLLCAIARRDYHTAQAEKAKEEYEDVQRMIRETGVKFEEITGTEIYSNKFSSVPQFHVEIDPKLQQDMQEAKGRLDRHRNARREYKTWVTLLEGSANEYFEVTYADAVYFGIAKEWKE